VKIQLELETDDLHRMITEYFNKSGFEVKNIDDICAIFSAAFPDGLKIDAGLLPPPVAPVESPTCEFPVATEPDIEDNTEKEIEKRIEVNYEDGSDIYDVIRRSRNLEQGNRGSRDV
jgi:hypothetical protein